MLFALSCALISLTIGVIYGIYTDLQGHWPTLEEARHARKERVSGDSFENIEPHAESNAIIPGDTTQAENVMFADVHPGYRQETPSFIDPIRDAVMNNDATLENFFQRPVKIASYNWAVNTPFFERINPWHLYFTDARVINRISNFRLLRAKLKVKVTINGNAFHYGRVLVSYNPLYRRDTLTIERGFVQEDLVAATQRPHIFLNPTASQGGEMVLPFFTPENALDIVDMSWIEMGELCFHSMQMLQHANGATDNVTINVFAWAEDVSFSIPTHYNPGAISPQADWSDIAPHADEYGDKPVSRIAGAIANFASYLVEAPYIGPFARATEIGAKAVGAMASIFGYAAPVQLEYGSFRPVNVSNYAVTNMPSDAFKLTVDAKQELTVDPKTAGLDGKDELSIAHIVSHESYLDSFDWAISTASESLLWNTIVDPKVHVMRGNEIHMPSTCFASVPFQYWRGTLKYRFQVVCSAYHKGRLRIVYDPVGTSPESEYNTAYTTIVDISETTDFTIDVGWGQNTPYREGVPVPSNGLFGTTPLGYTSTSTVWGNGTLAVYVVNDLTTPSDESTFIEVNVFISASDDFEVAAPDGTTMEKLRFRTSDVLTPPKALKAESAPNYHEDVRPRFVRSAIAPHAEVAEKAEKGSAPTNQETLNSVANSVPISNDPTNLVHFGESIRSMRQMLKRFSRHVMLPNVGNTGSYVIQKLRLRAFPTPVGFYQGVSLTRVSIAIEGKNYIPGWMTFLQYLTSAYGGYRGSIRWAIDFSDNASESTRSLQVSRLKHDLGYNQTNDYFMPDGNVWFGDAILDNVEFVDEAPTYNGTALQYASLNPVVQFEIPYYHEQRFDPGKHHQEPGQVLEPYDLFDVISKGIQAPGANLSVITTHVAGGEDYTCFFYLGPPIFYYEDSRPRIPAPEGSGNFPDREGRMPLRPGYGEI